MIEKINSLFIKKTIAQIFLCISFFLFSITAKAQSDILPFDGVQAEKICLIGDIDNLGFGWPSGYDVFSGKSTPAHRYPWSINPSDASGMDRIIVGSGAKNARDGYASGTKRPGNNPQPIYVNCNLTGINIHAAVIQIFVDDFQAPVWKSKFQVSLNGKRAGFIEEAINSLNQTGPIGKLLTLQVPDEFIPDIASEDFEIFIDDPTSGQGDGFAIDFVRILINPTSFTYTGIVIGKVIDATTKQPLANALVSAGGIVSAKTDASGNYTLNGVPAGMASLTASASSYLSELKTVDLPSKSSKTLNFELKAGIQDPPTTSLSSKYPTSWEVNCNGYVGQLKYTVDPNTDKVTGTLLGTAVEGFIVDRHLVLHRFPKGRTQIWDGWIIDRTLGAKGEPYYKEDYFLAGTGSQSLGKIDGVYPWYGTASSTTNNTGNTGGVVSGNEPTNTIKNKPVGKILWTHNLPDERVSIIGQSHGGDLGTRMALGLDGSIYYAAGGGTATWVETKIYAINKQDGSLKWRSQKLDAVGINSHILVGNDGTIYVIGYMTLYALNPDNGSTKWTWKAPERLENKPTGQALANLALQHNGDIVLTAQRGGAVYCLDTNGKRKWYNLDSQGVPYSISIGPDGTIYSINELYLPDYDGGIYLVSRNGVTGKKKWVHKTGRGIGGGNNIVFDANGNLIASFIDFGATENKLHKIDPGSGNIIWSSNFKSGQHGIYLGPDEYAYQVLSPPGKKYGVYRLNLTNSQIEMVNWSMSFGCIDNQNKLIHNFKDPSDGNKVKLGAFSMDGTVVWKADIANLDDRTFLISNNNVIYASAGGNQIVAIQGDAPLAQSGWPRLGSNNRNTYSAKKQIEQ